jgi:hypothetical protein
VAKGTGSPFLFLIVNVTDWAETTNAEKHKTKPSRNFISKSLGQVPYETGESNYCYNAKKRKKADNSL